MKNIIFIGMPGCGKTTIGKELSKELGLNFIDLDNYIEKKNNITIPEMFLKSEEYFRNKESEAVDDVKKFESTIISTGGGVVKRWTNMNVLIECGYIIFIDRKPENIIETLNITNRPLLIGGKEKLFNIYNERYDLYKKYSNLIIDNNGEITTTIERIKEVIANLD